MNEMYRGATAAFFATFPSRYLSKLWFDKETNYWQYELSWFVIFLAMYLLGLYLTRQRFPLNSLKPPSNF